MERKDLLKANARIFESQGKALNQHAKKTVKVWSGEGGEREVREGGERGRREGGEREEREGGEREERGGG